MKDSLHTLCYATTLGVVCALLLTGASSTLAPYRKANAKAEKVRNILSVLGVDHDPQAPAEALVKVFEDNIRVVEGGRVDLYQYLGGPDSAGVRAVAVPFDGPGLWGPIEGFLALAPDMKTIRGITFHKQEETPGLGGEIAAPCKAPGKPHDKELCPAKFRHRFEGKQIVDAAGAVGIYIRRPGRALKINEVDGITGATMTCQKVEAMLNEVAARVAEERNKDG